MRVAALFSGGKDSAFALWCTQMQGWDVESLVTVFPESKESWMFHFPGLKWTKLQAEAIGLPQLIITTKGEKERELSDLTAGLEKLKKSAGVKAHLAGSAIRAKFSTVRVGTPEKSSEKSWEKS